MYLLNVDFRLSKLVTFIKGQPQRLEFRNLKLAKYLRKRKCVNVLPFECNSSAFGAHFGVNHKRSLDDRTCCQNGISSPTQT